MQRFIQSLRAFVILALILGLAYPLLIVAIGQLLLPYQANGSLLEKDNQIIGSALIAQEFTQPKYFHSRFSTVAYDAANSGASNFAPSSKDLITATKNHLQQIRIENNFSPKLILPADMALASGSGLDPHISLANAMLQLPRVATTRNISESKVKALIHEYTDPDFIGIWGEAGVNVLELNLALDDEEKNYDRYRN